MTTTTTTNQEIFDRVATHLLTQRRRSAKRVKGRHASVCMYRGPKGTSCAVGCLISDEAYDPTIEDMVSSNPAVINALTASGVEVGYSTEVLLGRLQRIHDSVHPNGWRRELRRTALELDLDSSVLN